MTAGTLLLVAALFVLVAVLGVRVRRLERVQPDLKLLIDALAQVPEAPAEVRWRRWPKVEDLEFLGRVFWSESLGFFRVRTGPIDIAGRTTYYVTPEGESPKHAYWSGVRSAVKDARVVPREEWPTPTEESA
jgi:hypothetical protein